LAILEVVPFELETVSKAEQGYRLLSGYTEHPVKSVISTVTKTDTLDNVLKSLIWSCLEHFQNNLRGAMDSDDAEYLHQMRVALRRLRVVLRMAEKVHADEQVAALSKEVADLCVALGRIREWDVFIAQTMQPMCARMPGHSGLQALLAASEGQRAGCYEALRGAAKALELQRLLLRFAIWMNGVHWRQAETGQLAKDFATLRLHKLAKCFALAGLQLKTFDVARLHALRILAKKLRYSAEFFASFYDKRKSGDFLAALSKVQDVLGQINDVAVAHRLLDGLAADVVLSAHQEEAVVLSRGWIAHDLSSQLTALRKSMRNFKKQPVFWKK
jgi:CHAD domain-containing protein